MPYNGFVVAELAGSISENYIPIKKTKLYGFSKCVEQQATVVLIP